MGITSIFTNPPTHLERELQYDTTVIANTASAFGGGIYNDVGTLTMHGSSVISNTVSGNIGGGGNGEDRKSYEYHHRPDVERFFYCLFDVADLFRHMGSSDE